MCDLFRASRNGVAGAPDAKEPERVPLSASGPDEADPAQWNIAGIRDCWLGGSDHTDADYAVAEQILVGAPYLPYVVRVYRELLGRLVTHLVQAGVRQFLDLGSGLPTAGNVHQVAQVLDPECRVVYVDVDAAVVARGQELLTGNDYAVMVCEDLRRPAQVWDAATRSGSLDGNLPVAVLMIDTLHLVPDSDDPAGVVAAYVDAVCPGSCLAVAHTCSGEDLVTGLKIFSNFYTVPVPPLTFRDSTQIISFFEGLTIAEPGIVPAPLWRPDEDEDPGMTPESFPGLCCLGWKP